MAQREHLLAQGTCLIVSLAEVIAGWEQKPFQRGSTDCCAFCDYVLKELTGESCLPNYNSDESAESIVADHGSLENAVSYYMGSGPIPATQLKPGDIALLEIMGHESIGILMPTDTVAVVFEYGGLREVRSDFIEGGWAVGR